MKLEVNLWFFFHTVETDRYARADHGKTAERERGRGFFSSYSNQFIYPYNSYEKRFHSLIFLF